MNKIPLQVIIFDEATSALDVKHEEEVQAALDAAAMGITSITISHRLPNQIASQYHGWVSPDETLSRLFFQNGTKIESYSG